MRESEGRGQGPEKTEDYSRLVLIPEVGLTKMLISG